MKTGNSQLMKNMLAKRKMLTCHTEHQVRLCLQSRNVCRLRGERRGMTNYPIGPNRTPSVPIGIPSGPNRTPPDPVALNIVLPPANHMTVIHPLTCVHLANTFDNRYTRKVTTLNTIETNPLKAYSLLVSKVCADCAELRHI